MYCLEAYDEMPCGVEERTECEKGALISILAGPWEIISNNGKLPVLLLKSVSVKDKQGRFAPSLMKASQKLLSAI